MTDPIAAKHALEALKKAWKKVKGNRHGSARLAEFLKAEARTPVTLNFGTAIRAKQTTEDKKK